MNIFTRFLSQWSDDGAREVTQFAQALDPLEALAIRVYKAGSATAEDEAIYQTSKGWFDANYANWAERLAPFWQESLVGGSAEHEDPFLFLTQYEQAADFVNNWLALQYLPAAREALNRYIVDSTENAA